MDSRDPEFLQKVGGALSESMTSVFSMLTGREFRISPSEGRQIEMAEATALQEGKVILVKANYQKGLTGSLLFAIPLKEGTQLVDLMLGGEGATSEELGGDARDALSETFNQVMGSANQAFSELAGDTLSIANVEISVTTLELESLKSLIEGEASLLDIPLDTTQDALHTIIHTLMPDLLHQQLKRKLGLGESMAASSDGNDPAAQAAEGLRAPAATGPTRTMAGGLDAEGLQDTRNLDLLLDIELPVVVRMGQAEMQLGELLKLTPGAILELNRTADSPVELLVNGKLIAHGEVVVVDGNFAFRITEIESRANRIRSLG